MLDSWHGVRWSVCMSRKSEVGSMRCWLEFSPPVWRQGDTYQFEEDLTAWDTRITEYERDSGKMVDPEVRMAVITQHAPQSVGAGCVASCSSGWRSLHAFS